MSISAVAYRHMRRPHRCEVLNDAHLIGTAGNPDCGPFLHVFLRVEGGRISAASFQTYSCPWSIAAGSALAELAEGLNLEDARKLDAETLERRLDGVPRQKKGCLHLAIAALKSAVG